MVSKYGGKRRVVFLFSIYLLGYHFLSYGNQLSYSDKTKYITKTKSVTHASNANILVRDPFYPLILKDCIADPAIFHLWALRGVLGHHDNHHAWMIKPDGSWQRLTEGDRLFEDWKVVHIGSRQIDLLHDNPKKYCSVFSPLVSRSIL